MHYSIVYLRHEGAVTSHYLIYMTSLQITSYHITSSYCIVASKSHTFLSQLLSGLTDEEAKDDYFESNIIDSLTKLLRIRRDSVFDLGVAASEDEVNATRLSYSILTQNCSVAADLSINLVTAVDDGRFASSLEEMSGFTSLRVTQLMIQYDDAPVLTTYPTQAGISYLTQSPGTLLIFSSITSCCLISSMVNRIYNDKRSN